MPFSKSYFQYLSDSPAVIDIEEKKNNLFTAFFQNQMNELLDDFSEIFGKRGAK